MESPKFLRTSFLPVALAIAALSGCAPSSPNSPGKRAAANAAAQAQKAQAQKTNALAPIPDVATATSYDFAGTDNFDKPCRTGLREFGSRRLLCISIQDTASNKNCALDKRLAKFNADCAPEFTWEESLSCHFALIDPEAKVAPGGVYSEKALRAGGDLCVGRTAGGLDETGTKAAGLAVLDDILSDVDTAFVPASASGAARSHVNLSLYRKGTDGKPVPLMPDFSFLGGAKNSIGKTADGKYQYVVRCVNTWGCPGSAK